jgi:predicted small lipoprotein YifL
LINHSLSKARHARAFIPAVILWLVATMMIGGCGKKGPPEPPSGNKPPQVMDLAYSITENTIKLSWTIPQTTAKAKTPVTGFLIYQYQQPAIERECSNCPVIFKKIGDVPSRSAGAGQASLQPMVFTQTIERGYRYIYKVKAYDDRGIGSRDSNLVEFMF